jgi:hypothetical protein
MKNIFHPYTKIKKKNFWSTRVHYHLNMKRKIILKESPQVLRTNLTENWKYFRFFWTLFDDLRNFLILTCQVEWKKSKISVKYFHKTSEEKLVKSYRKEKKFLLFLLHESREINYMRKNEEQVWMSLSLWLWKFIFSLVKRQQLKTWI